MRAIPRRLRALVLLLLFVSGGTSLPGPDALLFHIFASSSNESSETKNQAHIESDAGCASHAGHCGIGYPAGAAGALATPAATISIGAAEAVVPSIGAADFAPAVFRGLGFHSRAPPGSHA